MIWAITTRMDPARDTTLIEHTPIDYLDFASPVSGLGSKMGLDATNKWPGDPRLRDPRCGAAIVTQKCGIAVPNWVCSTDLTTNWSP